MNIIFLLLWFLCVHIFLVCMMLPIAISVYFLMLSGDASSVWFVLFMLPINLLLGIFLVLGVIKVFYRSVEKTPEGKFDMFASKGAVLWAINNGPSTLMLKWFQSTLFLNDQLRYLFLKALDCDVKSSSWITSNTHLSDLRNISVGENSFIGEMCFVSPSIQTKRNHLIVANIKIGDDVMIGWGCSIGPGVIIADGAQINVKVNITMHCHIGEGTVIGGSTNIYPYCRIGKNVKIGIGCTIKARTRIPDNTIIPDRTVYSASSSSGSR